MTEKEWRPVPGYDKYLCSNSGDLYSLFLNRAMKPADDSHGYLQLVLARNGIRKSLKVHKIVALTFLGDIASGLVVNHKDGNKRNNNVSNLEIVTKREDVEHAIAHGLMPIGEDCTNSKLSNSEVFSVLKMVEKGDLTQTQIGGIFSVHQSTISDIVRGRSWARTVGDKSIPSSPRAKLNADKVIEIRELLACKKYTQLEIATIFGVSDNTISDINCGIIWRGVK